MTRVQTQCDIQDMSYVIRDSGADAGSPSVEFSFGEEREEYTIKSVKAQTDSFGWTRKLSAKRTPMVVRGQKREGGGTPYDPCFPRYEDAAVALLEVMDPAYSIMDCRGIDYPSDDLAALVDKFSVRLSQRQMKSHADGDREDWKWFANQARYDDSAEFILEVGSVADEKRVSALQKNYKVPNDCIYLDPAGDTIEDVNDDFYKVEEVAKRNQWKINPRMEFLQDSGVEYGE